MTSGKFETIPIDSIYIDRENRQRRELNNIPELAASIRENGLINPIVVTRDYQLIAGERRYTAHKHLGWDQITVQYLEDMDEESLHLIELEENIRREDLSWQDHVAAVARYHELKKETQPSWSQDDTADALHMSRSNVTKHLLVKNAMDKGVEEVIEAPRFSTAANFAARRAERQKTAVLRDLRQTSLPTSAESDVVTEEGVEALTQSAEPVSTRRANILNTDFMHWSKEIQEVPFNLIHCDFPYGVNAGDTSGYSSAKSHGGYKDSKDIYFSLLEAFCNRLDNFCAPSAHLIFWFSMDYYQETLDQLRAAGWSITPFPLIWYKSDNTGILPDPQRGPRRIYETAFFGSRGDRKVVRPVGNATAGGVTKDFHMSEKPVHILEHFFRLVVDETTTLLDPTCGSGNSVKTAEMMSANYALGLEINSEYVERAKINLDLTD